jgi:hypothetical protein
MAKPSTGGGRRRDGVSAEWVGGSFLMPAYVMEEDPYRPELALWLEVPAGLVVGHGLASGKSVDGTLAQALRDALLQPPPGAARMPARLRVADHAMAAELGNAFGERFAIDVAPTPELDAIFEQFVESMPDGDDEASYLEGGRVPQHVVARMFEAAAILYRAAPWKVASDDEVLRMDIPSLGVEGACVSIIGALGESLGLIVFPSLLAYEHFGAAAEQSNGRAPDLGGPVLSLDFWRASDAPGGMRREIARHGWPTVSPAALPVVTHRDRDGLPRPLSERDVRIAAECAFAVASFFVRHPDAFGGRLREPVSESIPTGDGGVTVRLTAPYEARDEFEPLPQQRAASVAPGSSRPSGKVGRNEPCACGSGKKYKRCCLYRDESARLQERKRSNVHELDERIVRHLREYAAERYGAKWKAATGRFVRAAGSAEPLLVQLAAPWCVYEAQIAGQRAVDGFLEEEGGMLSPEERAWLTAQQGAVLSVWEVTACEPGVSVTARDLLSGDSRRIHEARGSRGLVARDAVLARVVDYEGASYFCGIYPRLLPPHAAARVTAQIRRRAAKAPSPDADRDEGLGLAMIRHWAKAVREEEAAAAAPKKLVNTDGEAIVMTTDHFELEAGAHAKVRARLVRIEGVEHEEDGEAGARFTVFKQGNAVHAHWDNTVLAHLTLGSDRLRLDTNSVERADRLRARLEAGCGALLRHRMREHADPLSSARPARESTPRPEPPPEALQALRELKAQHYATWIDTPFPALGGRTPRQAARTQRGREQVDVILRSMENGEHRAGGGQPFDFGPLRRGLGIDVEPSEPVRS